MFNYAKLIMLLVDHNNYRTVIECNDTSKLINITIISFGSDFGYNDLKNNLPSYVVTDLITVVVTIIGYYR